MEKWEIVQRLRNRKKDLREGVLYGDQKGRHLAIRWDLVGCDWFLIAYLTTSGTPTWCMYVIDEQESSDGDKLVVNRRFVLASDLGGDEDGCIFQTIMHHFHQLEPVNNFTAWRDQLPADEVKVLEMYVQYHKALIERAVGDEMLLRKELGVLKIPDGQYANSLILPIGKMSPR